MTTHWLLPVDPAAHPTHLPPDWRGRPDAGAVWEAIALTQPIDRWCLRNGYRTMRAGETIWAYLSRRQELCAVGTVRAIQWEDDQWRVLIDWDEHRTAGLGRAPLPRSEFGQVPMSTCRANQHTTSVLDQAYRALGEDNVRVGG